MPWTGKVTDMVGLLIESQGPAVGVGDFCEIVTSTGRPHPLPGGRLSATDACSRCLSRKPVGFSLGDRDRRPAQNRPGPCGAGSAGPGASMALDSPWTAAPSRSAGESYSAVCGSLQSLWSANTSPSRLVTGIRTHRQPAALRHRAAHRTVRRQRRRQEHVARRHVRETIRPT